MNITINPDLEKFIDEQVKSGRFSSVAEALEAGIARLMIDPAPDVLDDADRNDLCQSLDEMRQGKVIDAAELHAQIRKRLNS